MGDDHPPNPGEPPPSNQEQSGPYAVTARVAGSTTGPKQMRTFAQIIADEKESRNILEIKLTKKVGNDVENPRRPENLSLESIGELLFDVIKLKAEDCERVALVTNRYDTKEVKLKPGVDPSPYLTSEPIEFKEHEVIVRRQSCKSVEVAFKNVPLCIPDEEIINLCNCYGEAVNNEVYYKPSELTRGVLGSTRFVEMKLNPGKQFENFYWMEGPLDQDQGGRITVLHDGQIMQCSHCLRRADSCPGGGKGKLCRERKTRRGEIADYMRHLKLQHNYVSLKMKFREEFPQLDSGRLQDGFEHMVEFTDESPEKADDDVLGNITEETGKDEMILSLQRQLSEANQAREQGVHELAKLKASVANQGVNMMIGMNKNKNSQINIRADNFQYDPDTDMLQVLDEDLLEKELEYHCTAAEENKEKKIKEMKRRVLS